MRNVYIRKAELGDEKILAYIQTESWKAAFADILSEDELARCTNLDNAERMYRNVLSQGFINLAIAYVDDLPHCIAAWGRNRCGLGDSVAELICIHSLRDGWRKGYGSTMMQHVLAEAQKENYIFVVLWVFEANARARRFYEKHGFELTSQTKAYNGIAEVMYRKKL